MPLAISMAMAQTDVERLLGKLITDEPFRREFSADLQGALFRLGFKLTDQELRCILNISPAVLASTSNQLDPRLVRGCADTEEP